MFALPTQRSRASIVSACSWFRRVIEECGSDRCNSLAPLSIRLTGSYYLERDSIPIVEIQGGPMATCEVCGNEYDKSFEIVAAGARHIYDSFECAIQAMAPSCEH